MKNKLGKRENLKEYHENGKLAYVFRMVNDNYSWEKTFDIQGNQTSYKDSRCISWYRTYNNQGHITSLRNSSGFSWVATYDNLGRATYYKDSDGNHWKKIYNEDGTYEQTDL